MWMYGRCSLNSKVDQSEVANHLDHRTTTFFSDRVERGFDEEPLASLDFDSSVKTATENDVRRQAIIIDDVIVVVVAIVVTVVVVVIVMN